MRHLLLAAAASLALTAPVSAAQDRFANVEVKVEEVAPGVAVLFGAGGNIGVSYGEDGTILVDDQFAGLTDKIVAAVGTLSDEEIRFVFNTHYHGDHTGGNENLGNAGALIMAHDNVRARLVEALEDGDGEGGLPVITFSDGVTLHWNGDEIHVMHVHNAHTDGDSIIHWKKANVVHMGDTYFKDATWPYVDLAAGGSIDGVIATAKRVLDHSNSETVIIPGHGPVATQADLKTYHDMLVAIRGGVKAAIDEGHPLDHIQTMGLTDGYAVATDGFISPTKFIEAVYKSLTGATDYSPR
ncbi:MBL fold metallo-hydrolase [Sphingomicrobium flavum]|uniref:MBL fold metallo-hydrolase n=1 Tax=Sphingomicrobium flavum TaxID=1229164 RepID=UPI0021AD5F95|nr:MBL fold metallo-hydrolase [Sphingomicrobium flavum]